MLEHPQTEAAPEAPDAAVLPRAIAQAHLEPTAGNDARGTVGFNMTESGLEIDVMLTGLAPGPHGMHIHEFGDCSAPDAASAGKHFNPHDALHGAPSEESGRRHAGDLGNVTADDSGAVKVVLQDPLLETAPDLKVVGRAVIVHAGEDDLVSQPGGESGDPVACGVIEAVTASDLGSALR